MSNDSTAVIANRKYDPVSHSTVCFAQDTQKWLEINSLAMPGSCEIFVTQVGELKNGRFTFSCRDREGNTWQTTSTPTGMIFS